MAAGYGAFMPIYAISVRQRDASQYITADYINLSINTLPIKTILLCSGKSGKKWYNKKKAVRSREMEEFL